LRLRTVAARKVHRFAPKYDPADQPDDLIRGAEIAYFVIVQFAE